MLPPFSEKPLTVEDRHLCLEDPDQHVWKTLIMAKFLQLGLSCRKDISLGLCGNTEHTPVLQLKRIDPSAANATGKHIVACFIIKFLIKYKNQMNKITDIFVNLNRSARPTFCTDDGTWGLRFANPMVYLWAAHQARKNWPCFADGIRLRYWEYSYTHCGNCWFQWIRIVFSYYFKQVSESDSCYTNLAGSKMQLNL